MICTFRNSERIVFVQFGSFSFRWNGKGFVVHKSKQLAIISSWKRGIDQPEHCERMWMHSAPIDFDIGCVSKQRKYIKLFSPGQSLSLSPSLSLQRAILIKIESAEEEWYREGRKKNKATFHRFWEKSCKFMNLCKVFFPGNGVRRTVIALQKVSQLRNNVWHALWPPWIFVRCARWRCALCATASTEKKGASNESMLSPAVHCYLYQGIFFLPQNAISLVEH